MGACHCRACCILGIRWATPHPLRIGTAVSPARIHVCAESSLLTRVDHIYKLRLEGSPADEEAINVFLLAQFLAVGRLDRP